jgi:tetratricopeptide (TPR) repeat protein
LRGGHLAQSRPHYLEALKADPAFAQAYVGLGGSSMGAERAQHLARARQLAARLPEAERLWVEVAWAGSTGHPGAGALIDRVVALAPDDWKAHHLRAGIAQFQRRDLATALAAYERAAELAPDRAPPYRGLATVRMAAGDFSGAMAAAERYAALSPGESRPLDLKGTIFMLNGRLDEAERAFRAALTKWFRRAG